MIVGTAGHIDHGKTTLVRALTGVDADRLPEEKKRGITIELGYAFMDLPGIGERIGFVDVPGHERLVHTMLAGATGIDMALLLVAADDGVMPQTREHLAVLSLLGIERGMVVITKSDRADLTRIDEVKEQVQVLLRGTSLQEAPVLAVSAQTEQGIEDLKQALQSAIVGIAPRARLAAAFRLAVDRAFVLDGAGTVVTGSIHAGCVQVGDELQLVPGELRARVRSVHAQNQSVPRADAGQRCALALVGIAKEQIDRGQWLVRPDVALSTDRMDVQLSLWHGETKALRPGTSVHVHVGAVSVLATVAMLRPVLLEPGQTGWVQLLLRTPIAAWHGDRVVLRDASASRTIAGGEVLDPFAPVRYRRTEQRLAELQALTLVRSADRLEALLKVAPQGIDVLRFSAAQGETVSYFPTDVLRQTDAHSDWAVGAGLAERGAQLTLSCLAQYHEKYPEELGPDAARLRRLALPRWPEPLWRALLEGLRSDVRLVVRGAFVHLPEHGLKLSDIEVRIAQKVAPELQRAGFEGAWVRDLARCTAEPEALMRVTLARLAQRGDLYQVVKDLYYPPSTMADLAGRVRAVAQGQTGEVLAAQFRDATGLGRKRAIQILEHFDRIGLLRRVGDVHKLRTDCTLFLDVAS